MGREYGFNGVFIFQREIKTYGIAVGHETGVICQNYSNGGTNLDYIRQAEQQTI
jgi:hypothetical protein